MPKKLTFIIALLFLMSLCFIGCQKSDNQPDNQPENQTDEQSPAESIEAEALAKHTRILSSDEYEGRGPSSTGEEKTISYISREFEKLGLKPGNSESYFQEVPLVSTNAEPNAELVVRAGDKALSFVYGKESMVSTRREMETVNLKDSEMVFIGYGIVAPEYGWNDYEGLDVRGKTVVMLVNDPGFATQDPDLFNGNAMTYYGRWTYKYEEAARQGAEAAFIIHETKPAAYPWEVVENSWAGAQFGLRTEDKGMSRCAVEGWFTIDSTRMLFEQAGLDFDQLKSDAGKKGFKYVPMNLKASVTLKNSTNETITNNVLAVLPGSSRPDEYVIYMAHWDHLGLNPSLEGDQIYNGALDNATGVAALIELAEAFTKLPSPPARSIIFLAVAAEEQGLLGSDYFVVNPIYPLARMVAVINMDGLNIYGKMKDITLVGYGNSELDEYVKTAAAEQGRRVEPDPEPEKGYFYRGDHFSFAKQGVPALWVDPGIDHVEHGEEWTIEQRKQYTDNHYHKPSDEFDPNWDLSGMVEDLQLLFNVGLRLANEDTFPNWTEGNEFKAKRDMDMKNIDQ